jgi:hypothetical protein
VKTWANFAAAVVLGLATPVLVLWVGRKTPLGTDPSFAGASLVFALGEYYWTWLVSALGGLAASLLGAHVATWSKRP